MLNTKDIDNYWRLEQAEVVEIEQAEVVATEHIYQSSLLFTEISL